MKQINYNVACLAFDVYEALDTPVSLASAMLLKYGEWDQIAVRRVDPLSYLETDIYRFKCDYQAVSLLRKYSDLPTSVNPTQVAVDKFLLCEHYCAMSSARFLLASEHFHQDELTPHLAELDRMKKWIACVLGKLPDFLQGNFGPGSTFESSSYGELGIGLTTYDKISKGWYASHEWTDVYDSILSHTPMYKACVEVYPNKSLPVVRGNRFTTVKKDASTDRGICIEPGSNMYFQKGIGREIRSRLRRFNLDLDHNQVMHQKLAQRGSLSGSLATIDLASASDTVSYGLVKYLLPEPWFDLLDMFRCGHTQIGDRWLKLHKFSSMGNGYTFELETLIFSACVYACGGMIGDDSFVFGDDIIIPNDIISPVTKLLTVCGFQLNPSKTYVEGLFRESCGGDYFFGSEVRPYFLKDTPCSGPDWVSVHNGLFNRWPDEVQYSRSFKKILKRIRETCIPSEQRLYGPIHLGDTVLHQGGKWSTKRIDGIRYIRTYVPLPKRKKRGRYGFFVQLAAALSGYRGSLSPRDAVGGYKVKWVALP